MSNVVAPSRLLSFGKWGGMLTLTAIYFALAWLALMSVNRDPMSGIPDGFTLDHYRELFSSGRWFEPMLASLAIGLLVGLMVMVIATLVARAVPRSPIAGRIVLLSLIPLFVPGIALGASLFIFLRMILDLTLGFWSIFIGHLIWAFPFSFLFVLVLTTRFDYRILDAAADLGASRWRVFWDIELPLLRPAVIGAGIFGFLVSFNEGQRAIFLHGNATTLPIWNWIMASSEQSQVPIIFCLETIVLCIAIPLLAGTFWTMVVRLEKD
jgi:ABC-type spermidine/putrescine transport system permease subunit II